MLLVTLAAQLSHVSVASPGSQVQTGKAQKTSIVVHKLQAGENLSVVARKYQVGLADLQAANPTLKGTLAIGQEIKIPASAKAAPAAMQEKAKSGQSGSRYSESCCSHGFPCRKCGFGSG